MARSNKPIVSEELWEQVLLFYALHAKAHNKHQLVSERYGLSRRTATKMWFEGYAPLKKKPIRDLVDTVEVRAKAAKLQMREEAIKEAESEIDAVLNQPADLEKAKKGDIAPVTNNALIHANKKNIVIANTLVNEILQGLYRKLPDMIEHIRGMNGKEALSQLTEVRQIITALTTASKLVVDLDKLIDEMSHGRGAADAGTITDIASAMRVLDMTSRFAQRIKEEPLPAIPTDGETVNATIDTDEEPEQDSEDDEWEDDEPEDDAELDAESDE